MEDKYYLGIDIGTESIGFAATDTEYNLLKKSSKSIWGVRLLDEANTAEERRVFRANRRRLQRRKERINILQDLFRTEVEKIDETFFKRLNESKYYKEDRPSKNDYNYLLFNDINFNDKNYHNKYKSIYHLRKDLIENKEKFDIRLIYLAVHNIIKNRGHFLFENLNDEKPSFKNVFDNLNIYLNNKFEFYFSDSKYSKLEEIIKNNDLTQREKLKELKTLFEIDKEDVKKEILLQALSNGSFDLCKLFDDENLKDDNEKNIKLKLSEINDERLNKIPLSDEDKDIILILKSIYDWSILENILKGNEYISYSKVKTYEAHNEDLKILKKFVIENFDEEKYNEFFKDENKANNYASYVGLNKKNGKKIYTKKCDKSELYSNIKKSLLEVVENKESKEYLYIKEKIEKDAFLPKQINKDNGTIPYQVHLFELKKILENAKEYYPFLLEKDKDGLTVIDKIVSTFKFKIPYYIGPLNQNSPFSWIIKNSNEKIYPWNFEKVVDKEKSSEEFILRMTRKCTYLPEEYVLPKHSLLYSKFMVLNEINKIKINGESISINLKKEIYNELFCNNKKVSIKKLVNFLKCKGYIKEKEELSGIDTKLNEINSSLTSYIDFKDIIKKYKNNDIENIIEEIIRYIVIFGDEKEILKSKISKVNKEFGNILSKEDIKYCCNLKYTGWGKLSKKLLTEITDVNKDTGEVINIINILIETNKNLMEILSSDYGFKQKIDEINNLNKKDESLLEIINNLYVSPKIKRPIYQSILIIKEIVKSQGKAPDKIFIETAREKFNEKNRTKKRKQKLEELYKSINKDKAYQEILRTLKYTRDIEFDKIYQEILRELKSTIDIKFDKTKLYLYFLQFGRCMYTGENISIEDITNVNICDRDHIYPKSKIKDDSLDNLVLVKRSVNSKKTNIFPINEDIRKDMYSFWEMLRKKGFISEEKYKRLTRKTDLTDDELNTFIERQLVETRQASKVVAEILKSLYPTTEIVYVKSIFVSDFRYKFNMLKCREVNDYHHAKDAYLNIVVGNVYNTEFTEKFFIKRLKNNKASLEKIFEYPVDGAWETKNNKSLEIVKNTMSKNDILFTRYSYEKRAGLFNQTLYPKGKNNNLLPIKKGLDPNKYGGYDSKSVAYYNFVEHTKGKKRIKSIEGIYMYNKKEYEQNPEKYCEEILGLKEPKIITPKIKINTLFSLDGFHLHLSGKSGDALLFKPAMQLILGYENEKYIKKICSCLIKGTEYFEDNEDYLVNKLEINNEKNKNITLYTELKNKILNTKYIAVYKNIGNYMEVSENKFKELTLYNQYKVIGEIIKILKCNATTGNLSILGQGSNLGKISISKNTLITNAKSLKIIHPSITGLYKKEIDLLKLNCKME